MHIDKKNKYFLCVFLFVAAAACYVLMIRDLRLHLLTRRTTAQMETVQCAITNTVKQINHDVQKTISSTKEKERSIREETRTHIEQMPLDRVVRNLNNELRAYTSER